jgi:hypothetical protein
MYFLIFPVVFLAVTPILNEPLNLFRSLLIPLWLLTYLILKPQNLRAQSIVIKLFILVPVGYLISAIVNGQNPILALIGSYNRNIGLLTFISALLILLIGSNSRHITNNFINYGLWPLVYLSIFIGFLQIFHLDPLSWAEEDRVVLFFGNSNFAGSALAILILVPLYSVLTKPSKQQKVGYFAVLVILYFIGTQTKTSQYYAISSAAIAVFLLINYYDRILHIRKIKLFGFLAFMITGASLVIVKLWDYLFINSNFADRIDSANLGMRIFYDHPFFGVGIEQMWRYQGIYRMPSQEQRIGSSAIVDKAHNVFIDQFVNGGIFVGLGFVVFILSSLYLLFNLNRLTLTPEVRSNSALFGAMWFGYVTLLFFTTDSVFGMVLGFASLGAVLGIYSKEKSKIATSSIAMTSKNALGVRLFGIFMLLPLVLISSNAISNELKIKAVVTNRILDGNQILDIIRSFPNPKGTEMIIVQALKNADNCPFTNVASDELLKLDDRSAQGWYFKALCSDFNGDYAGSLKFVNKALEFQPINKVFLDSKVRLEVRNGEISNAQETLKKLRFVDPKFAKLSEVDALLQKS